MSEQDNISGNNTGEQSSGDQTEQTTTPLGAQAASRRKFLRAALVGSAAVVAVGAGADAVLSRAGGGKTFLSVPFVGYNGASPTPTTFDPRVEDTALNGCITTYNGTGQDYFLFTIHNLPAGNYSFDATQQVTGQSAGPFQPKGTSNSKLPWDYSDNGNNIHVDTSLSAGKADPCTVRADHKPAGTGSGVLPVTFSLSATGDVQIYVHLNFIGTPPSGQVTTFTGTVTDTDTHTVIGSGSTQITAS